jgi:hypothetical protein
VTDTVLVRAERFGGAFGFLDVAAVVDGVATDYQTTDAIGVEVSTAATRLLVRDEFSTPPQYIDFDLSTIGGLNASQIRYEFTYNGAGTSMRIRSFDDLNGWVELQGWTPLSWLTQDPAAQYTAAYTSLTQIQFPVNPGSIITAIWDSGVLVLIPFFGLIVAVALLRRFGFAFGGVGSVLARTRLGSMVPAAGRSIRRGLGLARMGPSAAYAEYRDRRPGVVGGRS